MRVKRVRITVSFSKESGRWLVRGGSLIPVSFARKSDAVQAGIDAAKAHQPSQLVVFKKNGQIQEERTFPRSSDPRRSRG